MYYYWVEFKKLAARDRFLLRTYDDSFKFWRVYLAFERDKIVCKYLFWAVCWDVTIAWIVSAEYELTFGVT